MEATRRRTAAEEGGEETDETPAILGSRVEEMPPALGVTAYVGVGSNQGDRTAALRHALHALGARAGVRVTGLSSVFESVAHTRPGQPSQPAFLNAVASLTTTLEPRAFLEVLLSVERAGGRRRDGRRWEARPIDLDLLLFGDRSIDEPGLTVPHPRLAERRFVLEPLAELAPALAVPGTGRTVEELLERCPDALPVVRTELVLR